MIVLYHEMRKMKENVSEIKEEDIVKVNCSFCGKEIDCPKNMLKSKKHACYDCFKKIGDEIPAKEVGKIHVDFDMGQFEEDMPSFLAENATATTFPEIWKMHKIEIKKMSKKEMAKEMFFRGAETMAYALNDFSKELESEDERTLNKKTE